MFLSGLHRTGKPPSCAGILCWLRGLDLGSRGFCFGFQLEQLGEPGRATLAQALTEVVDQAKGNLVLIVDEVEQAITTEEAHQICSRCRLNVFHPALVSRLCSLGPPPNLASSIDWLLLLLR